MSDFYDDFADARVDSWTLSPLNELEPKKAKNSETPAFDMARFLRKFLAPCLVGLTVLHGNAAVLDPSSQSTVLKSDIGIDEVRQTRSSARATTGNLVASFASGQMRETSVGSEVLGAVLESESESSSEVFASAGQFWDQVDVMSVLSEVTISIMDSNCVTRLRSFARLTAGWDSGRGLPLQEASVKTFNRFFGHGSLRPDDLGIFMSTKGNLIANWPDATGQLVEIEFFSDRVAVYTEATAQEWSVLSNAMGELRRDLIAMSSSQLVDA